MTARTSRIPRLQELAFLAEAMLASAEGHTLDQIRLGLFDAIERRRASQAQTGNHAGVRRRGTDGDEFGYLHNATEALAELMRLGYLEHQTLPSSRKTLELHRRRTFSVTERGAKWVALLKGREFALAYDELLAGLWSLHPQLAEVIGKLAKGPFVIPTAQWGEAQRDSVHAAIRDRRENYIEFLAKRCVRAMDVEPLGWSASEHSIVDQIQAYVGHRVERAEAETRADPYPRGQDFVGACEEALVKFAFSRAGVKMDFVSLAVLRRWCQDLGIANFSYHVPAHPAQILWSTSDISDGRGTFSVVRRNTRADEDAVISALPESFDAARHHEHSDFVAVYLVRAAACHKQRVSDATFNRALARCLDEPSTSAGFRVHLDPAQYRPVPPTERPFTKNGRHFYSMTLVPTKQRNPE